MDPFADIPTRKAIEMRNGMPVPVLRATVSAESVKRGQLEALAQPYEWREGDPEHWQGMSKVQVGHERQATEVANGNMDELNRVHDRILGKPKQAIEQVSVNMTLQQWLSMLADKEELEEANSPQPDSTVIDVQATESAEDIANRLGL